MIRSLIEGLRKHGGVAGVAALAAVLAGIIGLRGIGTEDTTPVVLAADPVDVTTPLDDTGIQRWQIEAPAPLPEPDPRRETIAAVVNPSPDINWSALAVGASDVSISEDVGLAQHADVNGSMTTSQRQALIAEADMEAAGAGAGRLPGFVGAVVARGTPGGGSCK